MTKFKVSANENLYDLNEKDPYKTLYLSVILQALVDLSKPKRKERGVRLQLTDKKHMLGSLLLLEQHVKTLKQFVFMQDFLQKK